MTTAAAPRLRVQVLTDVDWDHMTEAEFLAQDDPTRPLLFIRYSAERGYLRAFREAFGVELFAYRAALRRLAEAELRAVRGATLAIGFSGFDAWWSDERDDELVCPIDDDDVYHPGLAAALAGVGAESSVVLWDAAQAGFIENEPVPGATRLPYPVIAAANWAVRKSFLRARFDAEGARRFLSDQELAQATLVRELGVSLEGRPEGPLRIFAPLEGPGVTRVAEALSVNLVHVGAVSFFWVLAERGDPVAGYRAFDPRLPIPVPPELAWAGRFLDATTRLLPGPPRG